MNLQQKQLLAFSPVAIIIILAFSLAFIPGLPRALAITTTTTIIGWNVPSGTTFGNGLVVLILPLTMMGIFALFPLVFEGKGDFVVTMALVGFLLGAAAGMLGFGNGLTTPTSIEFFIVLLSGLLLGLWLWKGAS